MNVNYVNFTRQKMTKLKQLVNLLHENSLLINHKECLMIFELLPRVNLIPSCTLIKNKMEIAEINRMQFHYQNIHHFKVFNISKSSL